MNIARSDANINSSATTWHVLGAGSLGGLWAARLYRAGLPVQLILRTSSQLDDYREQRGLQLNEGATAHRYPIPACSLADCPPVHRLLLACKAYDAEDAALALREQIQPGADVLLIQNGIGSQYAVARALPDARCIAVSSTEGAFRTSAYSVTVAGKGQNGLGDMRGDPTEPDWLTALGASNIPHQWVTDIDERLWRKLALNCAINPLTVLHDISNGVLGNERHLPELKAVCAELASLLDRKGYPTDSEWQLAETLKVIERTASNYSSMLQDVRAGRRTEIRYLLGHACAQASALGLSTPHLDTLLTRVRQHLAERELPVD